MRCPYSLGRIGEHPSDGQTGAVAGGYHPANRRGGHPGEQWVLIAEGIVQVLVSDDASSMEESKHPRSGGFADRLDVFVCRRWCLEEERILSIVRKHIHAIQNEGVIVRGCIQAGAETLGKRNASPLAVRYPERLALLSIPSLHDPEKRALISRAPLVSSGLAALRGSGRCRRAYGFGFRETWPASFDSRDQGGGRRCSWPGPRRSFAASGSRCR
jgi:hypothetical protein